MRRTVKKVIDGDTFVVNRKIGGTNVVRLAGAWSDFPDIEEIREGFINDSKREDL